MKVRINIATIPAISQEVECDDWDEMDEQEREDFILDEARELVENQMRVTHSL